MARSRRKSGGPTRDRFKRKKIGKGWSTVRETPGASRPVLRITDPVTPQPAGKPAGKPAGG
jgi:hypothetical protein